MLTGKLALVGLVAASAWVSGCVNPFKEAEILSLINADRAKAGRPALEGEFRLTDAARWHSLWMITAGQEHSNCPTNIECRGYHQTQWGENVFICPGSATDAHEGFMASEGHRVNILSIPGRNSSGQYCERNWEHVGIGVVELGDKLYVTEIFAHP